MKIRFLIMASLLVLGISNCNKKLLAPDLVGRWEWVKTKNSGSGDVITADSLGIRRMISFEKDNTFQEFRNDTLVRTTRYLLVIGKNNATGTVGTKIEYGDEATADLIEKVDGAELILSDNASKDGITRFFKRKP